MRSLFSFPIMPVLIAVFGLLTFGGGAALSQEDEYMSEEAKHDDHEGLHVAHGWARASLGQNPNSSAYVTVHNLSNTADRLTSLACAGAKRCSLHTHVTENGIMKMRPVESLGIGPGAHIEFKPGGYHIMMFDVIAPLKAGTKTSITLVFENAGEVRTDVDVLTLREASKMRSHDGDEDHNEKDSEAH